MPVFLAAAASVSAVAAVVVLMLEGTLDMAAVAAADLALGLGVEELSKLSMVVLVFSSISF
jgi:hypothetical protein